MPRSFALVGVALGIALFGSGCAARSLAIPEAPDAASANPDNAPRPPHDLGRPDAAISADASEERPADLARPDLVPLPDLLAPPDLTPALELVAGALGGPGRAPGAFSEARFDGLSSITRNDRTLYVAGAADLWRVQLTSGAVDSIWSIPKAPCWEGLTGVTGVAADGAGHVYYGACDQLFVVDAATGHADYVALPGRVTELAWAKGTLYLLLTTGLHRLDGTTVTPLVGGYQAPRYFGGLAYDGDDRIYLASLISPGALVRYSIANATLEIVGEGPTRPPRAVAGDLLYSLGATEVLAQSLTTLKTTSVAGVTDGVYDVASYGRDGVGADARFASNAGRAVLDGDALYVTDYGRIRRIDLTTRQVTTPFGTLTPFGLIDAIGSAARFLPLYDVATDGESLFVGDERTLRRIHLTDGAVSTLHAFGVDQGYPDHSPHSVAYTAGHLFVQSRNFLLDFDAATGNSRHLVDLPQEGHPVAVAADGRFWYVGPEILPGYVWRAVLRSYPDRLSKPTVTDWPTTWPAPLAVAASSDGARYLLSGALYRWRDDGLEPLASSFVGACALAVGPHHVFVGDCGDHTIRRVDRTTGAVELVVGTPTLGRIALGALAAASVNHPSGLALDAAGTLYISDDQEPAVLRIRNAESP